MKYDIVVSFSKEDPVNSIRFRHLPLLLAALMFFLFPRPARSADPQQERAAAALEQDLKSDPDNAELWLHLGFAWRKLEKISLAQTAFEKVAALNPREKDAYFMLGLIYEKQHKSEAAKKVWETYLSLEKDVGKRAVAEKHIHHLSQ
jgi:cytochrome c-type biogenesis protein CcmH/NrfG